jgi:uncharacterized membrane protein YoaK (UPF0700 family)
MFSTLSSLVLTVISLAMVVASGFAFIHCLRTRSDAYPAIGRRSKNLWLGLTGGAVLASLAFSPMSIFGIAAIVIAAVYLLDIRPRIAEITSGY